MLPHPPPPERSAGSPLLRQTDKHAPTHHLPFGLFSSLSVRHMVENTVMSLKHNCGKKKTNPLVLSDQPFLFEKAVECFSTFWEVPHFLLLTGGHLLCNKKQQNSKKHQPVAQDSLHFPQPSHIFDTTSGFLWLVIFCLILCINHHVFKTPGWTLKLWPMWPTWKMVRWIKGRICGPSGLYQV